MNVQAAQAFIAEAIDALSTEAYKVCLSGDTETMESVSQLQATIALDLERIDRAIGSPGTSIFSNLAESIKQAMVALHGAKQALETARPIL